MINTQTKEDLLTIFSTAYKIPGEYFILGIISYYAWLSIKSWNNFSWMLLLFSALCHALEFITPIAAGRRLLELLLRYFNAF